MSDLGSGPARTVPLAAEAASVWFRHAFIEPLRSRPGLPRAMHFISTHRCNARCVMCGIWKETGTRKDELSPEALAEVLANRLFSQMEFVGISGGEPFLRDDLAVLCGVFLEKCAKVKRLSLTTNGLLTRRMSTMLPEIAESTRRAGALLDVSVSVHGMGEVLDRIFGVDDAFAKIEQTIRLLEGYRTEGKLTFSMNCVLLSDNLDDAKELKKWAEDRGIPLSFVIGEHRPRFRTEGLDEAFVALDGKEQLVQFLRNLAGDPSQSSVAADKYREVVTILERRKARSLSCYYAMGGLVLGYDGRLYYCSHSQEIGQCLERSPHEIYYDKDNLHYREHALLRAECRWCPPYTRTRWEIEKDLPKVVVGMIRRKVFSGR